MESFFADKQNEAILKKINLASFAINLNFDDYNSYCRRSALYESLGLFKLSLDDAVKAISIDRTKDDGYIHQAKAFAGLKKYAEAEKSLNDCLTITQNKRDLILGQLEHLRYLAVKQIGFDDQISSLASRRFTTINDAINGAFSMDLEDGEATKSDGQTDSANISSVCVNINPSGNPNNNSSNPAKSPLQFSVNNQGPAQSGQQAHQQISSQNGQPIQLNNSNHITSNQIGQLTNSQVNSEMNNQVTGQMNSQRSAPVSGSQMTGQNNQLTSQPMSSNHPPPISQPLISQPPISQPPFTNPSLFLSSTGGDKSIYTSANSLISGTNHGDLISTATAISTNQQHFLSTNQHLLNQHENPSSTVLDNTPLSEMDMQHDGTDYSSDMQMWTESEMQIRSDNSDQTLIIDSNRPLPHFTTPSKDFFSDLNNDLYLSSPFTNNNSNSSLDFGDSLTTPQFNRKEPSTRHQAKKQRVIKNLMNELADHSSPSLYENSPYPETSPFSSVQSINTPKSNVIVSPRQSPLKQSTDHMDNLDDLDDLNSSINRAEGSANSSRTDQEHRQSAEHLNEDKSKEQECDDDDSSTKSASEGNKDETHAQEIEVQQVEVQNATPIPVSKPLTNPPFNIIITGLNSLNNGLAGSAGGGVIKTSTQIPILLQTIPLQQQFQVSQYRGPKVQPLPTVASSKENQQIAYLNRPPSHQQQQQQQSSLEELLKEHNVEIVDSEPEKNRPNANNVSNSNNRHQPNDLQPNQLSNSIANQQLGNFVPPLGNAANLNQPSNRSASPNLFNSTDLSPAQPAVSNKRRTVAKLPLIVKPPTLLPSKAINNENARSNRIGPPTKMREENSKYANCLTRRHTIGQMMIQNNDRTLRYKLNEKKTLEEERSENASEE